MPSYFDSLQKRVFTLAKGRFGFTASYTSADGLATWEGIVLFGNPSEMYKLAGMPFEPNRYTMEYQSGDLPGLLERVHARQTDEKVTVDGVEYYVTSVDAVHDGETFRANLTPFL